MLTWFSICGCGTFCAPKHPRNITLGQWPGITLKQAIYLHFLSNLHTKSTSLPSLILPVGGETRTGFGYHQVFGKLRKVSSELTDSHAWPSIIPIIYHIPGARSFRRFSYLSKCPTLEMPSSNQFLA